MTIKQVVSIILIKISPKLLVISFFEEKRMAFDHTRVNPDEIQSVLSQMNTRAAELVQLLQLLKNQMEALNFTWQGSSSIVLIELMSSWDANVQGILEVLSTYNKHLSQTASAYQDLDSSISRGFRDS